MAVQTSTFLYHNVDVFMGSHMIPAYKFEINIIFMFATRHLQTSLEFL